MYDGYVPTPEIIEEVRKLNSLSTIKLSIDSLPYEFKVVAQGNRYISCTATYHQWSTQRFPYIIIDTVGLVVGTEDSDINGVFAWYENLSRMVDRLEGRDVVRTSLHPEVYPLRIRSFYQA